MGLPAEIEEGLRRIGEAIRIARLRRNLTQAALAARIDCSRPTVQAIERGEPGVGLGHYLTALWVFGLDRRWVDAVAPESDRHGIALERQAGRSRAAPGATEKGIDNDF